MGIAEFINDIWMSDEKKHLTISAIEKYKKSYPDVHVFREYEFKPCIYYFHYEDSHGKRFVEFYRSYSLAIKRWEEEQIIQKHRNGKCFCFEVMEYHPSIHSVGFVGIHNPWVCRKLEKG